MIKHTKYLDTNSELIVQRHNNGIKVGRPHQLSNSHKSFTPLTIATIFQYPFNIYFLDSNSVTQNLNQATAQTVWRGSSIDTIISKSIFDIAKSSSASKIRENDLNILRTRQTKIFEEHIIRKDNEIISPILTIKSPWYDYENQLIGIFGCSIVINKQPLVESLVKIAKIGLLNSQINSSDYFKQLPGMQIDNVYFSKRESECLKLLIRGNSAREMGLILNLSKRTIEHYIENIKHKLRVKSKSELINRVIDYFYMNIV